MLGVARRVRRVRAHRRAKGALLGRALAVERVLAGRALDQVVLLHEVAPPLPLVQRAVVPAIIIINYHQSSIIINHHHHQSSSIISSHRRLYLGAASAATKGPQMAIRGQSLRGAAPKHGAVEERRGGGREARRGSLLVAAYSRSAINQSSIIIKHHQASSSWQPTRAAPRASPPSRPQSHCQGTRCRRW